MVKEGTWVFYKKCLPVTIIVPIQKHLLRYFIKKENPVQCSEGAMKLNRAYGPLIC